jgi:molybdopterin biosynthesis enzyme
MSHFLDRLTLFQNARSGQPLPAGQLGDAVYIRHAGNPTAALAGAVAFVMPLLARMAAARPLRAYAGLELHRKAGGAKGSPYATGLHIPASAMDLHAGHAIDVISFETRGHPPLAS